MANEDDRSHTMKAWLDGRWVIEAVADVHYEDGRQACIAEINEDDGQDDGLYVRFHSWLEGGGKHPIADLDGKYVRVEITVIDPLKLSE